MMNRLPSARIGLARTGRVRGRGQATALGHGETTEHDQIDCVHDHRRDQRACTRRSLILTDYLLTFIGPRESKVGSVSNGTLLVGVSNET